MAIDLSVDLAGIRLVNPVMMASGTFGYGAEYADLVAIDRLGAIVVKGIQVEPWEGNPPPRMVEVPGGLVNAIGLQGPGVEAFIADHMPFLREHAPAVLVNIWGRTPEAYEAVVERLDGVDGVDALEVNVSCPNVKAGGIAFGTDPAMFERLMRALRRRTRLPLIPKLPPNVPRIADLARVAEACGADAISLINTMPAMVIDIETRRPVLSNGFGGLSGPAVHSVAVKLVYEAARAVSIPVIGMGGITSAADAIELMLAGATAVAVGTATFTDPGTAERVIDGLRAYAERHGLKAIRDVIGAVRW